jgi:VWFA-related protein
MTSARLIAAALTATLTTVGAAQDTPQAPPPVFRSVADLIQVDVSVLDGKRVPVKGLTAGDFIVLENGRERPVEAFAAIELPARETTTADAAWTREVPADVATNRAGSAEGRILVILMDRSIPFGAPTFTARRVAAAAVAALGPNDLAAVVSTSGGVPENLSSNRDRLLRAINQRDWSTDISDEAKGVEAGVGLDPAIFNRLTDGRCLCGLCVLDAVTNVASSLEAMPRRRKSLLFIGSSAIFQAGPQNSRAELGCGQKLEDARKVMFRALDRSGLTVHSIDPRGLENAAPAARAGTLLRGADASRALAPAVQTQLEEQGSLAVLPDRTGGRVVINANEPEGLVPAIVGESQSYYVIGFRPSEPLVPGQSREIQVKVSRRDVRVHARREFLVPEPPASNDLPQAVKLSLGSALRSTLPVADLPLAMSASAFATPGRSTALVAVTVNIASIASAVGSSVEAPPPLSVAVGAFDLRGRPMAMVDQTVTLPRLDPSRDFIETTLHFELPPGEHELRAAVSVPGSARTASVFSRVTVPPFASVPLTMSNVAISASGDTLSVGERGPVPVVPTTARTFPPGANVTAFMRLYQGVGLTDPLESVQLTATVIDQAGAVKIKQALEFKATEFSSDRTADCLLTLPIRQLARGEYLLSLEARKGERVAGRALRFTVQ